MSSDLFDLSGDVAVVTGSGRGIGEGIAKVLAGAGAAVVCGARRAVKLGEDDLPRLERRLRLPAGRLGTPTDLGAAALFLCSPGASWVTGQVISIDGGM